MVMPGRRSGLYRLTQGCALVGLQTRGAGRPDGTASGRSCPRRSASRASTCLYDAEELALVAKHLGHPGVESTVLYLASGRPTWFESGTTLP